MKSKTFAFLLSIILTLLCATSASAHILGTYWTSIAQTSSDFIDPQSSQTQYLTIFDPDSEDSTFLGGAPFFPFNAGDDNNNNRQIQILLMASGGDYILCMGNNARLGRNPSLEDPDIFNQGTMAASVASSIRVQGSINRDYRLVVLAEGVNNDDRSLLAWKVDNLFISITEGF
jgi:hypothetical protein